MRTDFAPSFQIAASERAHGPVGEPASLVVPLAALPPLLTSVRSGIPVHPYAEQYPLLADAELLALSRDIAAHGQRESIVLLTGVLIDGRNRWLACAMAGVEPKVREFDAEMEGPVEDYIDSVNLHRRHLTAAQRAFAGARVLERLTTAGKARKTANLKQGSASPDGDNLTPSGKSIDEAARISGSSAGSIKAAVKVRRDGTLELIQAVASSVLPISIAAALTEALPDEQRAAVAGGSKLAQATVKKVRERARLTSLGETPAAARAERADSAKQAIDSALRLAIDSREPVLDLIQLWLRGIDASLLPAPLPPKPTRFERMRLAVLRLSAKRRRQLLDEVVALLEEDWGVE